MELLTWPATAHAPAAWVILFFVGEEPEAVGTGIVSFDVGVYSGRVSYSGFSFGTIYIIFKILEFYIIYIK